MTGPYDPLEHLPDPDTRFEVLVYARRQDLYRDPCGSMPLGRNAVARLSLGD